MQPAVEIAQTIMSYCGPPPSPSELPSRWNFDPLLLVVLAVAAAAGFRAIDRKRDRQYFAGSIGLSLFLFVSPFCALGVALFAGRSVHHLILILGVAPLLALAFRARQWDIGLGRATALQALIFWLWHWPAFYSAALSNDALFWLMQISITGSAYLFWAALLRSEPIKAVGGLLATTVLMGALGALLTFSTRALYAPHWSSTAQWGLAPIEDQQLAGLLMWAPGSLPYLLIAIAILYRSMKLPAAA
ncbi:cytochrome c oxidase assembly protein [Sphingomonas sp. LY29]|uniref:cytochrome c oxidase assembly protein n=1 Tax=Sphingomonas sp. LY29 TaxID=3095341 RepID=UPI002D77B4B1|nr:cytochrome c oxidase assembly protein [Sphingomonas sp. LY29]WRP26509.1 cytochrome c oxidase assembly protein [Sphingomonas sp. LY29]